MSTPVELCLATVIVLGALVPLTVLTACFDRRRLDGANVWSKPFKFEVSLLIHFATAGIAASYLSENVRDGGLLRVAVIAAVVSTAFEMVYILVQAARGQRSHFNVGTPFYAALYAMMALGAVLISALSGVVAWLVFVDTHAALEAPMRLAVVLGLGLSCAATLYTGFKMGGRLDRYVGQHDPAKGALAIVGWSRSAGDLRIAHFVASHMAQAVPAAGWLACSALPGPAASAVVCLVAIACVALVAWALRAAFFAGRRSSGIETQGAADPL